MKKYTDSDKLERLQKDFNSLKEKSNKEISELKKERRELRAKMDVLSKKQVPTINVSSEEIKMLKSENHNLSESISQLKKQLGKKRKG
ncbi:MAG: hypothetical protein NC102_06250 [Clostridium sp.]|nr:hypothetical protein [Clostridium sp.]